jgi:hypothetical protein
MQVLETACDPLAVLWHEAHPHMSVVGRVGLGIRDGLHLQLHTKISSSARSGENSEDKRKCTWTVAQSHFQLANVLLEPRGWLEDAPHANACAGLAQLQ